MSELLEKCTEYATRAHEGQTRWDGSPYINHPLAVMRHISGDLGKCVAVLHDVIEDCNVTAEELVSDLGAPVTVAYAVLCLSKQSDESYSDYIFRVIDSVDAVLLVKRADLEHNLEDLEKGSMRDKYEMALRLINDELDKRGY